MTFVTPLFLGTMASASRFSRFTMFTTLLVSRIATRLDNLGKDEKLGRGKRQHRHEHDHDDERQERLDATPTAAAVPGFFLAACVFGFAFGGAFCLFVGHKLSQFT